MGNETKPPAEFLNTNDPALGKSLSLILKFFGVPDFGTGLGTTIGIAMRFSPFPKTYYSEAVGCRRVRHSAEQT